MKNIILFLLIVTSHISLFGQTPCGQEQVVNFKNLGTFTTPTLGAPTISEDLEITGSADINVLNLNGLGIVGGYADNVLDYLASESMTFDFLTNAGNSGNAYNISYAISSAGQAGGNAFFGEHTLEAFDRDGVSLGIVEENSSGTVDVAGYFENISISKLTLTPINTDFVRIGSITFSMECVESSQYALQAESGDVYIESLESGVIFKSPNGDCWLMNLDNNGNLKSHKINCSN